MRLTPEIRQTFLIKSLLPKVVILTTAKQATYQWTVMISSPVKCRGSQQQRLHASCSWCNLSSVKSSSFYQTTSQGREINLLKCRVPALPLLESPISFYTLQADLTYVRAEEVSRNYERNASPRVLPSAHKNFPPPLLSHSEPRTTLSKSHSSRAFFLV